MLNEKIFSSILLEYQMQENERKVWHPIVWQQPPPPVEEIRVGEVNELFLCFSEILANRLSLIVDV